ncbi:SPOR domain-containing protein [Microbacterium sp. Sa4CUA7]|uniref:SPOR domain-containing protein n=1 Tax=Microbacterium pullorum TaxID=2762236 RepID=A0ABR8S534_9MICO|nr:SPOR domain-containing protein [Microbacterium pullorum]MBD7958600.1 SPOR domain-containing protein [Microbacterium pullorum]
MTSDAEKYWYNLTTGKVERGFESPAIDRAGPFDTEEDAARAPQLLAERSRAWAEEESREDSWGTGSRGTGTEATDQ